MLIPLFCCLPLATAGDWPQILGPNRDGQATGEKLVPWSETGPKVAWSFRCGLGFAGPAVADGKVVLFHRIEGKERIEALDAATGKSLWQADFEASYSGGINPDSGPRCVPVIHKGAVYVFGAAGDLHCVALATGAKRWSRQCRDDFGSPEGFFGIGSTPIVVDDKLLVNVGGKSGTGIVAFALDTGKTLWQTTDEQASYSSPASINLDSKPHAVFVTRLNAIVIDPRDGSVKHKFAFGKRGPTVNAATPLVFDGQIFVSASYGVGAKLEKLEAGELKEIWSNDESMSSQYTTCVHRAGYLYGTHGREDVGEAELRCIDAATGKVAWRVADSGLAHVILASDKLLVAKIDGTLQLATASPKEFTKLCEVKLLDGVARGLPALSNGRLFWRDTKGDGGTLKCVQVGE